MSNPLDPTRSPSSSGPDPEHRLIGRELGPPALRVLLYHLVTALPYGSPERARLLEAFSGVERVMYDDIDRVTRSECHIEHQRESLLAVLALRNLELDEPLRARVLACRCAARLEHWFHCALDATTLADVFSASGSRNLAHPRSADPDDATLQARILALGDLIELINPAVVQAVIRYITTALPTASPLRERLLDAINSQKRRVVPSVYAEMRVEGRAEGLASARAEARADAKIEVLFKLLAHRNLVLDDSLHARVLACTDEAQLERWLARALAASTVAEVFAEP